MRWWWCPLYIRPTRLF